MLGGQHLGGRHEHGLLTGAYGGEHRGGSDDSLPGSDIALQETRHRLAAEHVIADLGQYPLLSGGQFKWQRAEKPCRGSLRASGSAAHQLSAEPRACARARRAESRAVPGTQCAPWQHRRLPDGRESEWLERLSFGLETLFSNDSRRQRFGQQRQIVSDGGVRQASDRPVGQASGSRIHGRQAADVNGVVVGIVEPLPFRRDHSQLTSLDLDLARESDAHSFLERSRQVGLLPPPDAEAARAVGAQRLRSLSDPCAGT